MKENTPPPSLFKLAIPLIISFWMRSLFTFVDTLYASFLSDAAIAAISLAIPFEFMMIATWVGLSTGLTSYLSKAVGAGSVSLFDQFVQMTWRLLYLVIPLFIGLGLGTYFFAPYLGLEKEVERGFAIYASVLLAGSALTGFWSIIPDSIVKAHHDTRSTMIAGILSNVINLVLNTLFLFAFHWGLFGIALSTVLGRFGGLAYALHRARVLEKNRREKLALSPVAKEAMIERPFFKMMSLSLPASLAYILMASEAGVVNYLLADVPDSTSALAAYGIFYRVIMFALMPMIATTVAILPFVARYSERGEVGMIQKNFHSVIIGALLYSLFGIGPLCYFGAGILMKLLTDSQTLLHYGIFAIQMVPIFCLTWVPYQLSRPIFEGFQRGRPTVIMAIFRYIILALPLAFLGRDLASYWGATAFQGLMMGLLTATLIGSVVYLIWVEKFLKEKGLES